MKANTPHRHNLNNVVAVVRGCSLMIEHLRHTTDVTMRLNADFEKEAAVHFDPSQFVESPASGVSRFLLDRIGEEKARATTIVQYQPNS
jgi:hypothetical protein